jgi:hypothetical protein
MRSEHTLMEVTNPRLGSVTSYTFFTDPLGESKPVDFLNSFSYLLLDMLIKEKFQGEQMKEAVEEIQVENGIDSYRHF